MAILTVHQLSFIFGLLGNIVLFMFLLAPVPTFCRIYKKKSSEGYQSIPYVAALFSSMLLVYYGSLIKTSGYMIISINGIGCVLQVTYLVFYIIYAPRGAKIFTLWLVFMLNIGAFSLIMVFTILVVKGSKRITVVGWICASATLSLFVAPLCIMRLVIRTRSVEFMPFFLSLILTLRATVWFFYGLLIKDFYIALPNVAGFICGIAQIILYMVFKDAKKDVEMKVGEGITDMTLSSMENARSTYPTTEQPEQTIVCNKHIEST